VTTIHPKTRIGHIHLTVSDLDRALAFYRDVLGFEVTSRYGRDAVFLSAGGYHHDIGLNTWAGRGAPPPAPGTTGLYHFAILYPDRRALAGPCAACSMPACHSKERPTTASARRFTYGTRRQRCRAVPRPAGARMAARARREHRDADAGAGPGNTAR